MRETRGRGNAPHRAPAPIAGEAAPCPWPAAAPVALRWRMPLLAPDRAAAAFRHAGLQAVPLRSCLVHSLCHPPDRPDRKRWQILRIRADSWLVLGATLRYR